MEIISKRLYLRRKKKQASSYIFIFSDFNIELVSICVNNTLI